MFYNNRARLDIVPRQNQNIPLSLATASLYNPFRQHNPKFPFFNNTAETQKEALGLFTAKVVSHASQPDNKQKKKKGDTKCK